MARRKTRFSGLRRRLRDVGGVPSGTAAPELQGFYRYVTGQSSITVNNPLSGDAKKLVGVALIPFAITPPSTPTDGLYIVRMSGYSYKGLTDRSGLNLADFGLTDTYDAGADSDPSFYPALLKATYSRGGASTNNSKVSGVTGRTYSYTPKRTFSFPFGRTTSSIQDAKTGQTETSVDAVDELDVAKSLISFVSDGSKTGTPSSDPTQRAESISYEPELYKPGKAIPKGSTGAVSGVDVG